VPEVRGVRSGTGTFLRSFLRERLTVVLLLVLPPLVVVGYGEAMSAFPDVIVGDPGRAGRISGTLFSTAFLAGVVGLFQVISARSADGRLALAGLSRAGLFGARMATIVAVAAVATTVSFGVLLTGVSVAAPGLALGALALGGVIYGLIGLLVGSALSRDLEGSLVLVFLADLDAALSGRIVGVDVPGVELLPLHYPYRVFSDAVETGTLATQEALLSVGYAAALLLVAGVVYARTTGEGGLA
jgi:ABC-2 type transport system permease protein